MCGLLYIKASKKASKRSLVVHFVYNLVTLLPPLMKNTFLSFVSKIRLYILSHKKISIVALVVFALIDWYFLKTVSPATVSYQYTTVTKGVLSSVVSATGQVAPTSQVDLKPKVNANVTGVYIKAGDRVRTGQVLFRLDATDAYKQVRDARTSLASANIALEKLRNPKTIDIMTLNDSIQQEEESKKNEDQKVSTAYKNLLNSGLQAVPAVSYTTETAPTITGSYNKGVEGQISIAVYQGGSSGYSFSSTGLITTTGQVNTSVAQPLGDSGLFIKWAAGNPSTNWIIDIPNKQSSGYLSNYTAWQTAMNNRDIANTSSDRSIVSLKQKLVDLTPGDDDLDVRSSMIQVEQRENALADAEQVLSNYTITAPFDGVMASVTGDVGVSAVVASSNSSTALGTIVTDKKMAQVVLNEADIVKVKIGQKATITFDAVSGLTVEGTVVEINTLGTITSGVVTYKVKVAFNAEDIRILPNMSVAVDILTDSKNDVLYLPSQAVKRDANGYYVEQDKLNLREVRQASTTRRFAGTSATSSRIIGSSTPSSSRRNIPGTTSPVSTVSALHRVPVTIGLQTDTQTEIVTGLREGDKVVTKKITTVAGSSASAPSVTSLFRPQGQNTRAPSASPRAQ